MYPDFGPQARGTSRDMALWIKGVLVSDPNEKWPTPRRAPRTKAERRIERERGENRERSRQDQGLRWDREGKTRSRASDKELAAAVGISPGALFVSHDHNGKPFGPAVSPHQIAVRMSDPNDRGGPRPQRYPCGARALMRRQGIRVVPKNTSLAPHWAAMEAA